jgi:hypothetical protein
MKTQTWLPVFPGFYGTIFEGDETNEIDYINEQRETNKLNPIEFDQIDFDYESREIEISKECCNFIESELSEFVRSVKYENTTYPKEYNFTNNSINCEIDIKVNEVKRFVKANFKFWQQYLKDNYTSYDGFWSHHSNNAFDNEWNLSKALKDSHNAGAILQFICMVNEITSYDMYDCCEHTHIYDIKNYDQVINEEFCLECKEFDCECDHESEITANTLIEKIYELGGSVFSNSTYKIAGFVKGKLFVAVIDESDYYFKDYNPLELV